MIKAVIIDDEAFNRNTLTELLGKFDRVLQIVGQADSVHSGVDLIVKQKPQLVFLDVEMQDGTGFDLLKQIDYKGLQIIFITGHDKYAVQAFRYAAIDYLLKPLHPGLLREAIDRAVEENQYSEQNPKVQALLENSALIEAEPKSVVIKEGESLHKVLVSDIVYCEASSNYTTYYFRDDKKITVCRTLKNTIDHLPKTKFFRSHQSYLINMDFFRRFDKKNSIIELSTGAIFPVSMRRRDGLLSWLNEDKG